MAHVKHWASDLLSLATYRPTCVYHNNVLTLIALVLGLLTRLLVGV